jgi:hypothetical protein
LAKLAALPGNAAMAGWLHTLGYRGHITTKSRRYSVTMTALRATTGELATLKHPKPLAARATRIPSKTSQRPQTN